MKNVNVKGTIVSTDDKWIYDLLGIEATAPGDIEKEIREADGEDITFVVNSGGGDVFAGNEINYLISQYRGATTADIVGIAASIATVICCGADTVRMAAGAQYMIHNVSGSASGDYKAMDHAKDVLLNANRTISNTYRLKTGMSEKQLLDLMNKESWMDAAQAKEYGFVDEIIGDESGILSGKKPTIYNVGYANIISDEVKEKIRDQYKKATNPIAESTDILIAKNKITIQRMRGERL
ncbi:MAG: Clp protease ClpP [Lachnospiraceae bacterium]|nr:Clp protease ClpP [Lachnospiraceae bacterium]